MRSAELFSGCGGLAYGLSLAGFEHDLMVEWDADAVATVDHNRRRRIRHVRDWPLVQGDVRAINWAPFAGQMALVAGGPPCQPFSIGGKHRGQHDDRDMWPEAIRAVRETRPSAFLFENVRGLARPVFAEYLQSIVKQLTWLDFPWRAHTLGLLDGYSERAVDTPATYDVMVLKVNTADYGAAQKRHRVIVAGVRRDLEIPFEPPAPTHSRERLLWDQWVTGEYWVRHGLRQPPDNRIASGDRLLVRGLRISGERPSSRPWRTVRDALMDLGPPNDKDNHVFQPGARVYPGHTGSPLDQPAKALKAGGHGVPGGENMMVQADGTVRYFTVREAARLQGLPDTYLFPRSWTESMRQLGNAVPTQLSESMGRWMAGLLARQTPRRQAA